MLITIYGTLDSTNTILSKQGDYKPNNGHLFQKIKGFWELRLEDNSCSIKRFIHPDLDPIEYNPHKEI